ncbi:MAG: hypothetical protein ACKPKO_31970 [Candidatus Fonsibacter sp.]
MLNILKIDNISNVKSNKLYEFKRYSKHKDRKIYFNLKPLNSYYTVRSYENNTVLFTDDEEPEE